MTRLCRILAVSAAIIIVSMTQNACRREKSSLKLLLIGVDGASWKLINPMMKEGRLPNIKKLVGKGASATMKTLDSEVSEVIWTTIATGLEPEKHGIRGSTKYDETAKQPVPYRSYDIKAKTMWNILSAHGKTAGMFNWRISYPPEKINGFVVSNYFLGENGTGWAWPEQTGFKIREYAEPEGLKDRFYEFFLFMNKYQLGVEREFSDYLLKNNKVEFFAVYTSMLERTNHYFWKFYEPEKYNDRAWEMNEAETSKYANAIREFYIYTDDYIGELAEHADSNTVIMVISDHGFGPAANVRIPINLFEIFKQLGLADRVKIFDVSKQECRFYIKTDIPGGKVTDIINSIRSEDGRRIYKLERSDDPRFNYVAVQTVLNVLKKDRIIVGNRKYDAGKFITVPDAVINNSGAHDYGDAVFIMSGRNVLHVKDAKGVSVYDVAPTVLYLMGLPLARDMKGKALTELFNRNYINKHEISYVETYEDNISSRTTGVRRVPEDEKYKAELRALGYIQ